MNVAPNYLSLAKYVRIFIVVCFIGRLFLMFLQQFIGLFRLEEAYRFNNILLNNFIVESLSWPYVWLKLLILILTLTYIALNTNQAFATKHNELLTNNSELILIVSIIIADDYLIKF